MPEENEPIQYVVADPSFRIHGDPAQLFAALANAQGSFEQPKKTKTVTIRSQKGSYAFEYAPIEEILRATRQGLKANGLSVTQPFSKGQETVIRTILAHSSGAYLETLVSVPESGDIKGFGSSLTYLRRYQLAAILGVAADDDDDGSASTGDVVEPAQKKQQKRRKPPAPKEPKETKGNGKPDAPPVEDGPVQEDTKDELKSLMLSAGLDRENAVPWLENTLEKPREDMNEGEALSLVKTLQSGIQEHGEDYLKGYGAE